ncbi:MAG: isochorismatase family protein [Oscillospiraceae bacterium]|nr:isochorismatase family protein [Oscillospiraceae bacterium]
MKKLLLAVDLLNDFVDGALGSPAAQAMLPAAVEKLLAAERNGDMIAFLRDTHEENYLQTLEGRHLPVPHGIRGTHGWQVADAVAAAVDISRYPQIEKNSFGAAALVEFLWELPELEEVELIGICTGICVINNALLIKTFFPQLPVSVDAACCACVSPETHRAALEIMALCHVEIKN